MRRWILTAGYTEYPERSLLYSPTASTRMACFLILLIQYCFLFNSILHASFPLLLAAETKNLSCYDLCIYSCVSFTGLIIPLTSVRHRLPHVVNLVWIASPSTWSSEMHLFHKQFEWSYFFKLEFSANLLSKLQLFHKQFELSYFFEMDFSANHLSEVHLFHKKFWIKLLLEMNFSATLFFFKR